ncbi:MAG: serine/threonine-protein kinase, partial [Planctomycetota bacterium]
MAQATLELINQSVRDRFELSWLRQAPETIEAMLPDPSADGYLPTLEELVRIDFEKSWRRAERDGANPPALEGYLDRFPMLRQPDRLVRLLVKEQEMRSAAGGGAADSTIASVPIAERFPELAGDATAQALQDTVVDTLRDPAAETLAYGVWDRPKLPELGDFGEYELLGKLGAGGMGVVYRARQKGAEREVALKVVHAERQGSKSRDSQSKVVDRFRTEAKAAAQLQHENIVPVYDVGEVGDKLYFSMQLVEGESLSDMVDAGPLEPRRAAAYLRGVAQGIQAAHDRGILHRDLKPHNVMIDRRNDRPLVADFGLAKVVEADDQLTRSGEVIGTPSYMAPEQVSSAAGVDAAADLYALGATLYHLLTGRPPFKGPNTMATLRQVLFQEVVEPRQLNAAIDRDLNTICVKCLQKDASRRYRSAAELADDLGRYLEGRPIAARPVGPAERAARWCRRNPLAASMLGLAGVMAGLVFASVLVGYRQTTAALAVAEHNYELA